MLSGWGWGEKENLHQQLPYHLLLPRWPKQQRLTHLSIHTLNTGTPKHPPTRNTTSTRCCDAAVNGRCKWSARTPWTIEWDFFQNLISIKKKKKMEEKKNPIERFKVELCDFQCQGLNYRQQWRDKSLFNTYGQEKFDLCRRSFPLFDHKVIWLS